MKRDAWRIALAAAFFAGVAIALFYPALFLDKLIYGYDTINLGVPLHEEVRRSLAAHQWPLWMPDVLGGMPAIASCNLLFSYPSDFIGCISGLPIQLQLGLDATLHVAAAGFGMFLFLRRLGRSHSASVLGGFFFALSGSQISQIYGGFFNFVEGIALVPWAFWSAHKACEERSWFAWGLCGLVFALQILAGASQLFAYTLPAVALMALVAAWQRCPKGGGSARTQGRAAACLPVFQGLVLALVLAFLLSAPQLWLTLQYLPLSERHGFSYADFLKGSLSLPEALTWLVPGLFGWQGQTYHGTDWHNFTSEYFGLAPWALAAGALAALWRREFWVRWMAGLALAAYFLAQSRWTPFYALFEHVPVLAGFRVWSRILFLFTFAVCTLAAFGWDALRFEKDSAAALQGVCAFFGLALAACALAWALAPGLAAVGAAKLSGPSPVDGEIQGGIKILIALAKDSVRTTLELIPALLALLWWAAKRRGAGLILLAVLLFHAFDQKPMIARFVGFTDPREAASRPPFQAMPPAPAGLEPWRVFDPTNPGHPNNDCLEGYENLLGYQSMLPQSYTLTWNALGLRSPDARAHFQAWADLLNARYILHLNAPPESRAGAVRVFENVGAFPRAWLVGTSVKAVGLLGGYGFLADPRFDPRSTVALNADAGLSGPLPRGEVRWLARSPQAFSLAVSTDRASALVLSNFWYPSWKAEVDGRDSAVLKADGGLQAVLLGAGSHQVDFRFDPGLYYDAWAACLAGIAALLGLALREKKIFIR